MASPSNSWIRRCHLILLALCAAAGSHLAGQAPTAAGPDAGVTHTEEQLAALKFLDDDIARLDVLLERISDAPLKATTRGFIDVFKETRRRLRQAYDQTKYDELKFEVVAEFQRIHLWLAAPREVPLVPGDTRRMIFELEPSPVDPAEVRAALAALDEEIAHRETLASRLAADPERDEETRRLRAIQADRAALGRTFTRAGWDAVLGKLKLAPKRTHSQAGYFVEALVSSDDRATASQGLRRQPGVVFAQATRRTRLQQTAAQCLADVQTQYGES